MSDLLTRAKEIKNATEIGENTAERVGGVMVDTVNEITALQERAVNHEDALTTHGKQITALQTKVQDVMVVNTEQQTAINSQGIRLTEVEHRADGHDTQIAQINTDMKQMDDNILRHGEEIEDLQDEVATKQQELTLTVLDNGNIRIGNLQGQTKDFMPATPSGDPMHYAYEAMGAVYNSGADVIAQTPWASLVDDADYNAKWGLNLIPDNATFVKTLKYNGVDREVWQMKHPNKSFQIWVVADYASDGTKIWDDTLVVKRSGMWYMQGLGDLTNSDMRAIMNDPHPTKVSGSCAINKGRFLKFNNGTANMDPIESFLYANQNIEVWTRGYNQSLSSVNTLYQAYIRHVVSSNENFYIATVSTDLATPYISTFNMRAGNNITLKTPNISAKSVIKLIESTTATVTITFPLSLYDRLMDTSTTLGAELVALLESKSNITFARGE